MIVALGASGPAIAQQSTCFGTPSDGQLENGVQLPKSGPNFSPYSALGATLGRTHVHSIVSDIVVAAYKALETAAPGTTFVYGETGWKSGGRIRPHKTHRNGLSVDFMVPVLRGGRSVPLPATALNKFGYDIEFDDAGRFEDYTIDFEATAAHLWALKAATDARGIKIARVIFEVPLQERLYASKAGAGLKGALVFSTKPAWVRHDEHYHIDFDVPCKALVTSST